MFVIANTGHIVRIHEKSFRANVYSVNPFRMIGLIDVSIEYAHGIERVTLAYYRSSGTNSHKIKGLWYPIVGIKMITGGFHEFPSYINHILTATTRNGSAKRRWLAKSVFFHNGPAYPAPTMGFSSSRHAYSLLKIGKKLRDLYEAKQYYEDSNLTPAALNQAISSRHVYRGNTNNQRLNFELLIRDIYHNL